MKGCRKQSLGAWRIIPVKKWLVSMLNKSTFRRVVGPLPNGQNSWLINGGGPGMILQVVQVKGGQSSWKVHISNRLMKKLDSFLEIGS